MSVAIARSLINNFCRKITGIFHGEHSRNHSFGEHFLSNQRHFVISQQKFLIELRAITIVIEIKNLFAFVVLDKSESGNHLRHDYTPFYRCHIEALKNIKNK